MIYGPNAKGNFPRLAKLGAKVPVFPAWHNKRSMLYIDNLAELIPFGAFPPSHLGNAQASLALLSVWRRFVLQPINKMFATYYYDPAMSKYDFEYQLVSFEESLSRVAEVLYELMEVVKFDDQSLSLMKCYPPAIIQRLGYILTLWEYESLADELYELCKSCGMKFRRTALKASKPTEVSMEVDDRWKVIINQEIDIDEI